MRSILPKIVSDIGHKVSAWVADAAAHPFTQLGVLAFCATWWIVGLPTDILVATLSILAITLTQMVLNRQRLREQVDQHRDRAMHAKLDELLRSEEHANQELAGIEELEAEELIALRSRLAKSRADPAVQRKGAKSRPAN
jgi:low affinity Fe/Cu permease